ALKDQGKLDEAYTQFFKSTWSSAWRSAGYFELAEIASTRGDTAKAMEFCDDSLVGNGWNARAMGLKLALGDEGSAKTLAGIDPLDLHGMADADAANASVAFPSTTLDAAMDLMDAGRWPQAEVVLSGITRTRMEALALYDLGYCEQKLNHADKARDY